MPLWIMTSIRANIVSLNGIYRYKELFVTNVSFYFKMYSTENSLFFIPKTPYCYKQFFTQEVITFTEEVSEPQNIFLEIFFIFFMENSRAAPDFC
jgi:hypothetical protein